MLAVAREDHCCLLCHILLKSLRTYAEPVTLTYTVLPAFALVRDEEAIASAQGYMIARANFKRVIRLEPL